MSDRAITILNVERDAAGIPISWLPRIYVPVATLIFTFLFSSWFVYEALPLRATPPEQRKESGINPGLSPAEETLAAAAIEPGFASRGGRRQLLFIGNSQTMAIPYAQPWDISTPQWFQVLLSRRYPGAVDVHRGSLGGMTWAEVVIRSIDFAESAPAGSIILVNLRPEMFSDLSVRSEVRQEAAKPNVDRVLERLATAHPDLRLAAHEIKDVLRSNPRDSTEKPADLSWSKRLENYLQSTADNHFEVFESRDLIIQMVNIVFHKYRNRLFGVNSASVRPFDSVIYQTNLELLKELLQYSEQKHDHLIVYLGPLRGILPNPNPTQRIMQVRRDVQNIALTSYGTVIDYTDLVLEPYWTNYEPSRLNELTGDAGQPDFAHFREQAHLMVAEHLVTDLGPAIVNSGQDVRH